MGLIADKRHTALDLARWEVTERTALAWAQTSTHRNRVTRSVPALREFAERGRGYAGVSWGKDSVVLAHLIASMKLPIPLVWVKVLPISNPDCEIVRDAFLAGYPDVTYEEIPVHCTWAEEEWHATGTLERGFAEAARRYGDAHASGIRAEESGQRSLRMMRHGQLTKRTCAPIGWWQGRDVWAYLLARGLPVHPAYACTQDGILDPDRIRVASIGGKRGDGWGRAEWERRYYPGLLSELRHGWTR